LLEISTFLAENDLQFLGFDIDLKTRLNYARQFPGDVAMTDLALWHSYETDHPDTFLQMLTDVSVLGAAEQVGLTISGAHRRRGSPRSSAL
jgi:hypothetical protein